MIIKTFPVGAFQCNCSIIVDDSTGAAIVVDPGDEAHKICAELSSLGCNVKYLVHTHAHLDHIGATKSVCESFGGKICLHKGDEFLYQNIAMQAELLGLPADQSVLPIAVSIEHLDILEFGSLNLKVIHTPGHTPGSVCFFLENNDTKEPLLFSGDTLFKRSIGRTDLWGGDHDQILASIRERLFTLDLNTKIICGHGQTTKIGEEIKLNRFFNF